MSPFALAAGRRSKFLVITLALAIALGLGSQSGKLDGVISNDPAAGLPQGADSTAAVQAVRRFDAGETNPAVVVLQRAGGLSSADRRYAAQVRADLRERPLPTAAAVPPADVSPDATTAVLAVPFRTADDEVLADATGDLRDRLRGAPAGLQVAVTGPAALSADIAAVFDGADGRLLIGASLVVILLLIVNYRSPVAWLIPFSVVLVAEFANQGIGYLLGSAGLLIGPAGSGIASVLVFGAATDYALLLVARYREELRVHEDRHVAMARALRSAGPTIVASAATVAAALLTLLLCDVGLTRAIGPLAATGVFISMLLTLTLLPALLLVAGRRAFWPFIPRVGTQTDERASAWGRIGARIARRPRRVWVAGLAVLAVAALGTTELSSSFGSGGEFLEKPESIAGAELLARALPAGTTSPADVVVPSPERAGAVAQALRERSDLVATVSGPEQGPPGARLAVVLRADPLSSAAQDQIPALRAVAKGAGGPEVLIGGTTAEAYDLRQATGRDTRLVVPIALGLVLLILAFLLRALVLPVLVIATVVLSFAAALGFGAVMFDQVLGFTGSDPSLPLLAFVFLFSLGVDYTIFLLARVREEAPDLGTRRAMTRSLAATGAVITSAGLVLAGTFAVLAVLPLVALAQLGFVIGVGVLLDTLLVRSVIVPALVYDAGRRVWWPDRLGRDGPDRAAANATAGVAGSSPA